MPARARVTYETGAREANLAQQIWVKQGSLEVTVGTATYRLKMDDCLAMKLNAPITFYNRSRNVARYVVVISTDCIRRNDDNSDPLRGSSKRLRLR